jgi:hypothetical protein
LQQRRRRPPKAGLAGREAKCATATPGEKGGMASGREPQVLFPTFDAVAALAAAERAKAALGLP